MTAERDSERVHRAMDGSRRGHSVPDPGAAGATVRIDFTAVDAYLARRAADEADEAACRAASEATLGGTIARLAMGTFGSEPPPALAAPPRASLAGLVAELKSRPDPLPAVGRFVPRLVGGPILLFVVANGDPWGDAYVRSVRLDGSTVAIDDEGEPVIVLNAARIATAYRGDAEAQASTVEGIVRHELFHVLFERYRRLEPAWAELPRELPPQWRLALLVLDEGIGHFIGREGELLERGIPADRAAAALRRLDEAVERLGTLPAGAPEVATLLGSADVGPYWDKYGAISGMVLALGIFRALGAEGIRESVRCGPAAFIERYREATERLGVRPMLPASLAAHWTPMRLCGGVGEETKPRRARRRGSPSP